MFKGHEYNNLSSVLTALEAGYRLTPGCHGANPSLEDTHGTQMIQQGPESLLIVRTVNDLSGFIKIEKSHEQLNIEVMKTLYHGRSSHVTMK
jgi:hypothetical protein